MKTLSRQELQELFAARAEMDKVYRKHGTFLSRKADPGEMILTIVAGKLETIKNAGENDIVIVNITIGSSAERYIIDEATFTKRYQLEAKQVKLDGFAWELARARGEVRGFFYDGPQMTIVAPWGEEMLVNERDFIGNPVGGKPDDIYRIERDAFDLTYRLLA